jgi:phage replication-related protein YjqB (UPF0714/DUF867 family)
MGDTYPNFCGLAKERTEGIDFRICVTDRASPILIVAPHGGNIEPRTSQIAASIAGNKFSLYCFEGLMPRGQNHILHITSENFDEPRGRQLVGACEIAIGVHGREDGSDEKTVWLGGLDTVLRDAIGDALTHVRFKVKTTDHHFPGTHPANICNGGQTKRGAQFELPDTLILLSQ